MKPLVVGMRTTAIRKYNSIHEDIREAIKDEKMNVNLKDIFTAFDNYDYSVAIFELSTVFPFHFRSPVVYCIKIFEG